MSQKSVQRILAAIKVGKTLWTTCSM